MTVKFKKRTFKQEVMIADSQYSKKKRKVTGYIFNNLTRQFEDKVTKSGY